MFSPLTGNIKQYLNTLLELTDTHERTHIYTHTNTHTLVMLAHTNTLVTLAKINNGNFLAADRRSRAPGRATLPVH